MKIWRSAGWPSRDPIDIDLLAAGWVSLVGEHPANECLRLTDAGIALLAQSRQAQRRSESDHDKLALRMTDVLMDAGRLVWHELSLRAKVAAEDASSEASGQIADSIDGGAATTLHAGEPQSLWGSDEAEDSDDASDTPQSKPHRWRLARPDLFSIRRTSNPNYLHPVVHEIKVSRADLLGDLKRPDKRAAYLQMGGACWYVLGRDAKGRAIASPEEVPPECGVMQWEADDRLAVLRPAPRRTVERLPFHVWMALARATPLPPPEDGQGDLPVAD